MPAKRNPGYVGKRPADAIVEHECRLGISVRGVFPKGGDVQVEIRSVDGASMLIWMASVQHVAGVGKAWPMLMKASARAAMLRAGASSLTADVVSEAVRAVCDLPFGGTGTFAATDPVRGRCVAV